MRRAISSANLLSILLLITAACGGNDRPSKTDSGTDDGGVISGASCEAIAALCGWQTDDEGNAIYCGRCRWLREQVADEGWSVAMAMGEDDSVDALYFDTTGLVHATRSSAGTWSYQTIEEGVTERGITSPRLVRQGGGLRALFVTPEQQLKLAVYDGSGWVVSVLESAEYADLAVATDGTAHIVWSDGGALRHARSTFDGLSDISDVIADAARAPAIVVDSEGAPHVVWSDWNTKLRYATKSGETWTVEDVAEQSRHGGGNGRPLIALSSTGEPWLAHDSVDHAQVARRNGESWRVEDINTNNLYFSETVLAARIGFVLGRNDRPFVGLTLQASFNDDSFAIASPDDNLWGRQPIAPVGGADPYATIAIDIASSGEPAAFFASEDKVQFMLPIAAYSDDHDALCDSLSKQIYEDACACDESCCHGPPDSTRSICCTGVACSGDTRANLCGDPTRDESELASCEQSLSQAMCGPISSGEQDALALPEACFGGDV